MSYADEMADLRAWGLKQGEKGSRILDPTSVRLMLTGFFHRFKLIPSASILEYKIDKRSGEGFWLFSGLLPWWDLPGYPIISQKELEVNDTLRLRRIVQTVFRNAVKQDELHRVTSLRGKDLVDVLRAVGA